MHGFIYEILKYGSPVVWWGQLLHHITQVQESDVLVLHHRRHKLLVQLVGE